MGKWSSLIINEIFSSITIEEEKMLSDIFMLFEIIKAEESRLLSIREDSLAKYNALTRQVIIGGVLILMLVVLVLVNAVIVTLKSRIRAGYKLQNNLAEMERRNIIRKDNKRHKSGRIYKIT